MKKILMTLIFVMAMMLVVSCGDDTPPDVPPTPDSPTPDVEYTITWKDENGATIKTQSIKEGVVPSNTYNVTDTAEWDYTFEGWGVSANADALSNIPAASSDATYYAIISKVKMKYNVSFNMGGAPAVDTQRVEYGTCASEPEAPEYEDHRFMGWFSDADLTQPADFSTPVTGNITYYAKWNEFLNITKFLETLLAGYEISPYTYIPETMRHAYSANLVNVDDIVTDYSSFVNVSDITMHGFGEQWNMILDNISQSMTFFKVLTVVEEVAGTSIAAFNNYIDQNPAETAQHTFMSGIYTVTIDFDGEILTYLLDYTANIPVLGEQSVQIALTMNVESGDRTARVQLGDANALVYSLSENSYSFAIKYLGVRRAYFNVSRDANGNVSGHIYEYLTAADFVEVGSSADFYITDEYATAVGNKADGFIGFTGYISETYNIKTGKLIAYEVEETLKSITYNTYWFDLDMFSGFNSIKYREATDNTTAAFFVNGSSKEWESRLVGGFGWKMASRRFDIEFRTQYFYSYDAVNDQYVQIKAQVPMLFIQEENYDTAIADIKDKNGINLTALISAKDFAKVQLDYDTYIPVFIRNKEIVTSEKIVEIIGSKIVLTAE